MVRQLTPSRCGVLFVLLMFLALPTRLSAQVAIDATNFPDQYFRAWIQANYDDGNGYLDEAKAAQLTKLDNYNVYDFTYSQKIVDLTGIEYFVNMDSIRWVSYTLPQLDVSKKPGLKYLDCGHNKISELDLTNNTALTYLDCSINELTELDITNNTALTHLSCQSNQLSELDVTNNTLLTSLNCGSNQLTDLDIENNTLLTSLYCSSNQLTDLDIENNTLLTSLYCSDNQLTAIDVTDHTLLEILICDGNQLTNIDVTNNTALTSFNCGGNQLIEIDVTNNTALTLLAVHNNQLSQLDISHNPQINLLRCHDNQLTVLDLTNQHNVRELRCQNNLLKKLTLNLIEQDTSIYLQCQNNQLTALDLTSMKNNGKYVTSFNCGYNHLTSLELDGVLVGGKATNVTGNVATIVPYTKVLDGEPVYYVYLNEESKGVCKSLSDMIHEIEGEDVSDAIRFDITRVSDWDGDCQISDDGNILFLTAPTGTITYKYDTKRSTSVSSFQKSSFTLNWSEVQEEPSGRLRGDANGDGKVNSTDVVTVANYVLQMNPQPFVFENADVNEDGKVNITDLVGIANIILEIDE